MRKFLIFAFIGMLLTAMLSVQGAHCHGNSCGGEVYSAVLDAHGHTHDHDHDDNTSKVADTGDMDGKEPSTFHGWHSHSADSVASQLSTYEHAIDRQTTNVHYAASIRSTSIKPLLEPPLTRLNV